MRENAYKQNLNLPATKGELDTEITFLKNHMDEKFEVVDDRFNKIDSKFEQIDSTLKEHTARFDSLDRKIDKIISMVTKLSITVEDNLIPQIKQHDKRLNRIEIKLDLPTTT